MNYHLQHVLPDCQTPRSVQPMPLRKRDHRRFLVPSSIPTEVYSHYLIDPESTDVQIVGDRKHKRWLYHLLDRTPCPWPTMEPRSAAVCRRAKVSSTEYLNILFGLCTIQVLAPPSIKRVEYLSR